MASPPITARLDVVVCALRGAQIEPNAVYLSRRDFVLSGPPQDWLGVPVHEHKGDSYVLVELAGQAERAPLKLRAFAEWFAGKADLPPEAFEQAAAVRPRRAA